MLSAIELLGLEKNQLGLWFYISFFIYFILIYIYKRLKC